MAVTLVVLTSVIICLQLSLITIGLVALRRGPRERK